MTHKKVVTGTNKRWFVELFGFPALAAVTDQYAEQLVAHHQYSTCLSPLLQHLVPVSRLIAACQFIHLYASTKVN